MPFSFDESRTIEELITLHELEDQEKNIYVEGNTDKYIIDNYLDKSGIRNVIVYEINSINIPYSDFIETGMPDGNRSRVIHLAQQLEDKCKINLLNSVVCIADLDFDAHIDINHTLQLLLFTDGTSLELYTYSEKPLDKFLKIVIRQPDSNPTTILNSIEDVLRKIFAIRLTMFILKIETQIPPIDKVCTVSRDIINIDDISYIDKILQKANKWNMKDDFFNLYNSINEKPVIRRELCIHGHDYFSVLKFYLEKTLRKRGLDDSLFGGGLLASLEKSDFDEYPMFQEILNRLS